MSQETRTMTYVRFFETITKNNKLGLARVERQALAFLCLEWVSTDEEYRSTYGIQRTHNQVCLMVASMHPRGLSISSSERSVRALHEAGLIKVVQDKGRKSEGNRYWINEKSCQSAGIEVQDFTREERDITSYIPSFPVNPAGFPDHIKKGLLSLEQKKNTPVTGSLLNFYPSERGIDITPSLYSSRSNFGGPTGMPMDDVSLSSLPRILIQLTSVLIRLDQRLSIGSLAIAPVEEAPVVPLSVSPVSVSNPSPTPQDELAQLLGFEVSSVDTSFGGNPIPIVHAPEPDHTQQDDPAFDMKAQIQNDLRGSLRAFIPRVDKEFNPGKVRDSWPGMKGVHYVWAVAKFFERNEKHPHGTSDPLARKMFPASPALWLSNDGHNKPRYIKSFMSDRDKLQLETLKVNLKSLFPDVEESDLYGRDDMDVLSFWQFLGTCGMATSSVWSVDKGWTKYLSKILYIREKKPALDLRGFIYRCTESPSMVQMSLKRFMFDWDGKGLLLEAAKLCGKYNEYHEEKMARARGEVFEKKAKQKTEGQLVRAKKLEEYRKSIETVSSSPEIEKKKRLDEDLIDAFFEEYDRLPTKDKPFVFRQRRADESDDDYQWDLRLDSRDIVSAVRTQFFPGSLATVEKARFFGKKFVSCARRLGPIKYSGGHFKIHPSTPVPKTGYLLMKVFMEDLKQSKTPLSRIIVDMHNP